MGIVEVPDAELAGLARDGDVEALAVLLQRCRPSLYATAMGLLHNRADALDAVQDACVVALVRLGDLRDAAAVRAWLQTVVRNICLMRLRQQREIPAADIPTRIELQDPEQVLEHHAMRDWIWQAVDRLTPDERVTVMLRHFTRDGSYEAIAQLTGVPVGTVRSRLNRGRSRLADALLATVAGTAASLGDRQDGQHESWEEFYRCLHEQPVPRTYRDLFAPDVEVRDTVGHWHGIEAWSAEERQAISLGVRATLVDVIAGRDITVVEIDFDNPRECPDHCPPQATFVHRRSSGLTTQLSIHYPSPASVLGEQP